MHFEINRCWNCKSKNLHNDNNDFIVCMDCREVYEIVADKAGCIDWWIWKRQYDKKKQASQEAKK